MHKSYRRRLPHVMPPGETLFITFRLHGTVPFEILLDLQEEHKKLIEQQTAAQESMEAAKKRLESRYFVSFDQYMDRSTGGDNWLLNDKIAQLVADSLHFGQGKSYDLHAYCIMPNHVHVLLTVLRDDAMFPFTRFSSD